MAAPVRKAAFLSLLAKQTDPISFLSKTMAVAEVHSTLGCAGWMLMLTGRHLLSRDAFDSDFSSLRECASALQRELQENPN